MADRCSVVWIHTTHILFNCCSSIKGHLSFQFGAVMNNVPVGIIRVHVLVWTYIFISLRWIPRSEIAGSYGMFVFKF